MGKKARWILLVAALLFAVGFVFSKARAKHEPVARIALPDGTELRLEYVTYGTEHRIPGAGKLAEFVSRLLFDLPHSRIPYQRAQYTHHSEGDGPCAVLWFTQTDPRTGKFLPNLNSDFEIKTLGDPNGSQYLSGQGDNTLPMPNVAYEVLCYDRRKPDFRVQITTQNQTKELVVPNPVAGMHFPVWKPEPLPQMRRVADRDLILRSLRVTGSPQNFLRVTPEFEVLDHGQKMPGLAVWHTLIDATGNTARNFLPLPFDETAWKVHATVRRNGDFPFAPNEGLRLGSVEMPGAGELRTFKLPEREVKDGFRMAVLFGPGHFLWKNGVFTEVEPPGQKEGIESRAERDFGGASLLVNSKKPVLVLLFGFSKDATAEMKWVTQCRKIAVRFKRTDQDNAGEYGLLNEPPIGGSTANSYMIGANRSFDLRGDTMGIPPAGTPVSIQIVPVEDETVEFLVAPPKLPEPEK